MGGSEDVEKRLVLSARAEMIHQIHRLTKRVRRAIWNYRQHLTHVPEVQGATVSDLFIWRSSSEWETFFEIIDMPSLFTLDKCEESHEVQIVFFDKLGHSFLETTVEVTPNRRKTLALSEFIQKEHGEIGTFCIFHSHTPKSLCDIGSHLAERGYTSYRYHGAPLRSYVHGNLDAIANVPEKGLQHLGGKSFLSRQYCLQYCLEAPNTYELAIVNPTPAKQKIICRSFSLGNVLLDSQVVWLPPKGCHTFKVVPKHGQQRVVFSSHLVMARPLIFKVSDHKIDVFHG